MPRKFYVRGQRHPNTTQVTPSPSSTRKPIVFFFQVTWWPSSWPPASTSSLWHKTALITSRKHIRGCYSRCERTGIEGCWQSGKYGEKELRFLHGDTHRREKKGKNPKASIKDYQGLKPLWPARRPKSITPIQTHPKPTKINFRGMFSPAALQSPRRSRSSLLWSLHFVAFAAVQSMPDLSLLDRRWFRWGSFRWFEKCCFWRLGIWLINIDHGSKVELLKWQLATPMSLSEFGK